MYSALKLNSKAEVVLHQCHNYKCI